MVETKSQTNQIFNCLVPTSFLIGKYFYNKNQGY